MSSRSSAPPSRSGRKWLLAALLLVVLATAWWALARAGHPGEASLADPAGTAYGESALGHLERGYHAQGAGWQTARDELRRAGETAQTEADLYGPIRAATQAAGGGHSHFFSPAEVAEYQKKGRNTFETPTVRTSGGVTEIRVPALGVVDVARQEEYARAAADRIDAAAPATCGWIIDLRGNSGGNMYPMLSGLTALLPNGEAMSFRDRHGDSTAVTVQSDGVGIGATETSVGTRAKVDSPLIAVLQDNYTASAGEAVATAFLGLEGVRSFGVETAGLTSGNEAFSLPDGAILNLTTSVYVDRTGRSLQERPIAPDEWVVANRADAEARRWLERQGCG